VSTRRKPSAASTPPPEGVDLEVGEGSEVGEEDASSAPRKRRRRRRKPAGAAPATGGSAD
jgi:hypothetical protein